ncbi:MAG: hypothetical protein LBH32_01340 [Dysgonamonadaceae bacterium]|jgi:hypothetical protein|nr:hypothetical protein [Dysgonamonadaceae bacterium]
MIDTLNYKTNIEAQVADALLDVGVRIPLKTFHFPFRKKPVQLRVTLKRPCLGTQIRIARLYLEMDVTCDELAAYNKEKQMHFMSEHGAKVSRMIALTICRGLVSGYLFSGIVAWFLRWFVENIYMEAAYERFVSLLGTTSFENIIKSAEMTNPLKPLNLSQKRKGS